MNDGFFRAAAATPEIRVADCQHNKEAIRRLMETAAARGVQAVVFPELCLTGYTCGDLFLQEPLLRGAEQALGELMEETAPLPLLAVVGLPVRAGGALYNCAAVFCGGRLLGLSAKSSIPNYGEFYEARHFTPAPDLMETELCGQLVPLGRSILYRCAGWADCAIGVEICEDLWGPEPPGTGLALAGATLLLNPSASDEVVGRAAYRRSLVAGQSARLLCGYVYADAGEGESTTDLVFSGHNVLAENGAVLAESAPFTTGLTEADFDLERMAAERRRNTTWQGGGEGALATAEFSLPCTSFPLRRAIDPMPFVPKGDADLAERCEMILSIQAAGLRARLRCANSTHAVVGVSGGLDSTLALLVCARAFDSLGLPRSGILAVSMPGFGTTGRTRSNAQKLAELLGAEFRQVPIGEAVQLHFRDIGHDPEIHDVTYENSQARERTQVIMDLANQNGGLVVGTGDLSELALGWATYNGDHMSMYGVNASIPKTLVRHLVRYAAAQAGGLLEQVLLDVLDTPVSPELLPPVDGDIAQKTEDIVGPYELHDFFLYYLLRFGFGPGKIYRLACAAFQGAYEPPVVKKWLAVFYRRFFAQQFKRSCLPDGPKVGTVALSPRGDWRMPSDASARLWMAEIEAL